MPPVDQPDYRDYEPNVRQRWQESPQSAVDAPAKALIAVGAIGIVLVLLMQGFRLYTWATFRDFGSMMGSPPTPELVLWEAVEMAQGAIQLAGMVIAILGARKMLRLESYGLALTAAVLMMLPWVSPCCLLGLPFGIWAITVLNRSEVREAFRS